MKKEITGLLRYGKEIEGLYYNYKRGFFRFITSRSGAVDSQTLDDIYQESFLALIESLKKTTVDNPKNYLYTIGWNKWVAHNKLAGKFPDIPIDSLSLEVESYYQPMERERMCQIVYEHAITLGSPCKEVLNLYYWENKSMKEIAAVMGYKNEQVAKNRKSACMQKIKLVVIQQLRMEGLI